MRDCRTHARLHDMRHNHACYAVMGGETLFVTGSVLDHRSAQTTARYPGIRYLSLTGIYP